NPKDRPVFEQIVRIARARGVTGFGAGEGYMRPGSMHIGFGAPAVWGRGGSGKNAPAWLRAAFENREPPPMVTTPSPAPVDTVQTVATTPNIPANALAMAASADVEPAQATAPVA